jgi:hypothetical protein
MPQQVMNHIQPGRNQRQAGANSVSTLASLMKKILDRWVLPDVTMREKWCCTVVGVEKYYRIVNQLK